MEIVASSMLSLAMQTILCSGSLLYITEVFWCRCCKCAEISNRQHLCWVRWTDISASNWHSYGNLLYFIACRLFFFFYIRIRRSIYRFSWKWAKTLCQDDALSPNNSKFSEYLELIYPRLIEIKETSETITSSSFLDLYLYIDKRKLITKLYDKWDDFSFPIVNFPFLNSNIPSAATYGVYVSQLIRYARACFE